MKICNYTLNNSYLPQKRLGILIEEENKIVDPNIAWATEYEREGRFRPVERAEYRCSHSLHKLLSTSDDPIELLEEGFGIYLFLEKIGIDSMKDGTPISFRLDNDPVSLNAPLDKIETYRDFYAHEKHVKKGFEKRNEAIPQAWYEIPAYYKGPSHGFIGHGHEILWPFYTDILDYELELGMVVGKCGKNIKEAHALDHIFGFTILNDISARDIQKKEMAVRLGPAKGKDFCSILGPVITTFDEFSFKEPDLLMTAKVNGEEWSRGQSGDSQYSWAEMISHVSKEEWVVPGDLFGSGTVGTGCGLELDRWIKPGDTIELEVENIGKLTNQVGQKRVKKYGKL